MAVYFFFGEEDYNIDLELEKMRSKLNKDFLSMSYQTLDNPDFSTLINAIRTLPMMFGKMLYVVDINKYYFSDDYNFEDNELKEIEDGLSNCNEDVDIVFIVRIPRNSDKKIDSRRKLTKILSKFNTREFQPFPYYKVDEIAGWIISRGKDKKITVKDDAANLLAEQIGSNLVQLDKELDKLKLAAHPQNIVDKKMVEENCTVNQSLFKITDNLANNRFDKAVLEYKQLLDTKYPLEIISAVQTMIRQWIIIKAKSKASAQEVMKLTGIKSEFLLKKIKDKIKNVQLAELVKLKEHLFDVEYRIKSGQIVDMDSEVECAFIR